MDGYVLGNLVKRKATRCIFARGGGALKIMDNMCCEAGHLPGLTFFAFAEYPVCESEKSHTEGCVVMNESRNRLCDLNNGACARVEKLLTDPQLTGRLTELGLLPGTAVRCRMRAPSGSPIVYEIRGASVAIRRQDASKILVRPEASWD